ncbi:hypothetical protein CXB51_014421 [Gossypium anomalum]|uniref:ER membrane protein complex subunit 7 beta-sandwich domain-containing protein n=1 Tax=Gossypium anomalum TaxID=47600 RepID=A0A8J5ZA27_9ROSI|nr:hypothetical protein CXB51_014421 [Gossypium anomalum]
MAVMCEEVKEERRGFSNSAQVSRSIKISVPNFHQIVAISKFSNLSCYGSRHTTAFAPTSLQRTIVFIRKGDELILQVQAQKGILCPEECPTSKFYSMVRVDVSARNPGKVQAALTENRKGLSELVLEPLREEQYYEIREPFSIMSLLKSPMGLMVGFMLAVAFLMPKLVENMDPEEMRRAQEEMRSQGVPSLSSLLPGGARN